MPNYPLLALMLALFSCSRDNDVAIAGFDDNFDNYASSGDVFTNTNWTKYVQTYSENQLEISTDTTHAGAGAIRLYAVSGVGKTVPKSDLASEGVIYYKMNDIVRISTWLFIPNRGTLDKLFILDIEDPASISTGPGIRLMFGPDNDLMVERNKMGLSNMVQPEAQKVSFPFDQWVNVVFELKLCTRRQGYVKLWQNDTLLIDESDIITLPKDRLYITQGTHNGYANIEVGITANSTAHDVVMFVDDFSVWKIN